MSDNETDCINKMKKKKNKIESPLIASLSELFQLQYTIVSTAKQL